MLNVILGQDVYSNNCSLDLNNDGKADFVTTANDGHPSVFLNQSESNGFGILLKGPPGNPTAVGARIEVHPADGPAQMGEVHALS